MNALPADDTQQGAVPGSLLQAGQHLVVVPGPGLSHAALFFDGLRLLPRDSPGILRAWDDGTGPLGYLPPTSGA